MFDQTPPRTKARPQRLALGNVNIPGTKAGAVVSIGLVIVAWIAVPLARPFLLGTALVGGAIGGLLWWQHNRE